MTIKTADELLHKLAVDGGVIVNTSAMTEIGIAEARACGCMYVNEYGLGFVVLHNAVANPKFSQPERRPLTPNCQSTTNLHIR